MPNAPYLPRLSDLHNPHSLLPIAKTASGSAKGLKQEPVPMRGACTVPVECRESAQEDRPRRGLQISTARVQDGASWTR